MRSYLAIAGLMLISTPAWSAEKGMYLCASPILANDYWNDLMNVQATGVQLTSAIVGQVARKHRCQFMASDKLKPVSFVAGVFQMSDGKVSGYATPNSYIIYVNRLGDHKRPN